MDKGKQKNMEKYVLLSSTKRFEPFKNGEKEIENKRAQRALGRSPEDKVKGYSGAIYKGPLMLSTKYWKRFSR